MAGDRRCLPPVNDNHNHSYSPLMERVSLSHFKIREGGEPREDKINRFLLLLFNICTVGFILASYPPCLKLPQEAVQRTSNYRTFSVHISTHLPGSNFLIGSPPVLCITTICRITKCDHSQSSHVILNMDIII